MFDCPHDRHQSSPAEYRKVNYVSVNSEHGFKLLRNNKVINLCENQSIIGLKDYYTQKLK